MAISMHPVLFPLGPATLYTPGTFLAIAMGVAALWTHHEAQLRGLAAGRHLPSLLFLAALGMVVGGRLGYVLVHAPSFWEDPKRIFLLWQGGMDIPSGLVLGAIFVLDRLRCQGQDLSLWLDILAPGVSIASAIGATGCLLAGYGMGEITDLPWAVRLTHPEANGLLGVPLHPLPMYFALAALFLFFVLCIVRGRLPFPGQAMGLGLTGLSFAQLAMIPISSPSHAVFGPLDTAQTLAIVTLILGLWLCIPRRHHVDRANSRR